MTLARSTGRCGMPERLGVRALCAAFEVTSDTTFSCTHNPGISGQSQRVKIVSPHALKFDSIAENFSLAPMIIAPSLLAGDFGKIAAEARRIEKAKADWIHLDIMDGHFVPNISFGPQVVHVVREETSIPLDVHLMCSRPEILLEPFAKAGADRMTIHIELGAPKVNDLIWKIRQLKKPVGLAINPPTVINEVEPFLDRIDLLLVMTVNPGFGGQPFIHETLPKVQQAAAWRGRRKLNFHIEVDGGINFETAAECARCGADTFVSGTGLLKHTRLKSAVSKMRQMAEVAYVEGLKPA